MNGRWPRADLIAEIKRLRAENRRLHRRNRWLVTSRDYWRWCAGSARRGTEPQRGRSSLIPAVAAGARRDQKIEVA